MRFATLASGSKGNSTVIEHGDQQILVDCGLSARELTRRMELLGVTPADTTAILITHEHGDHVTCLKTMVNLTGLAPHMTIGTAVALGLDDKDFVAVRADETVEFGGMRATPFTISHDAREPVSYSIATEDRKVGMASDIGMPNEYLAKHLAGSNALLLECNYDDTMLDDNQEYPIVVKQRIRGPRGHLSNNQASQLLSQVAHPGLRTLVACHVSENNNDEKAIRMELDATLGKLRLSPSLHVAGQHNVSTWYEV